MMPLALWVPAKFTGLLNNPSITDCIRERVAGNVFLWVAHVTSLFVLTLLAPALRTLVSLTLIVGIPLPIPITILQDNLFLA